jgi:CxxC motif-containing protein (DUF1111 family)
MPTLKHAGPWIVALVGTTLASALVVGGQTLPTSPGDSLPGITPAERAKISEGRDLFIDDFSNADGLGPAFNGTNCGACHNVPAIGGAGVILETRAAYRDASGAGRGLNAAGDSLIHLFSVVPFTCQPMIPADATVVAHRASIPLFGAGLIEAIPDETLRGLEDPFDRNGDGIRGRAAIVPDLATGEARVGRFGWKAQHATLLAFVADAFRNEMGIPSELLPQKYAFGFTEEQLRQCNSARGIINRGNGLESVAAFLQFLAPVARGPIDEVARDGERVFNVIGCAACHVPALTTGPSSNPLFNRKTVPLFSDLLLHDIGTGDGIPQASAKPEEIRTPALWGLRLRRPFLHDGSAATIEDAIGRHRQEAELAQRGFLQMSPDDRAHLLAFLRSL